MAERIKLTEDDIRFEYVGDIGHKQIMIRKHPHLTNLEFEQLKQQILDDHEIVERLIEEIKKCNEDYDRHEIPVDWNNVSCTGTVETILQSILTGDKK